LGGLGEVAVEPLIAALNDRNPEVRMGAALALQVNWIMHGDPRARTALIAALREHNGKAIVGAFVFYSQCGEPGAEDAIIHQMNKLGGDDINALTMANYFLSNGDPKMHSAAVRWAHAHHYGIL
jgi:hypothetical protein